VDFSWSDEQLAFRKEVVRFAREELNDDVIQRDREEEFFWDGWSKCGKFGIQGLPVSPEFGGSGGDVLTTVCALEALGYGCRDNGLLFSLNAHMWGSEIPLLSFGTEDQRKRYLPKLASGEWLGVLAVAESAGGVDGHGLQTRAQRSSSGYVLNGSKTLVTQATDANLIIVFASLQSAGGPTGTSAFIVEKGTPGLTVTGNLRKMGLRTSPMTEISLQDCELPLENLLGADGQGEQILAASTEWERICALASYAGTMQRLLETSEEYARERKQFGQAIGKFPAIARKITDMEVRLESSRLLLYKAAWLKSRGQDPSREAAMAKLYLGEACVQSCLDAIQIHGGYGYMTEYQIERELRDAISARIYLGNLEVPA
jgi:alkylation response protein AidB-like acyl-CoA dehydrogenase